jgi:hypothetical protein
MTASPPFASGPILEGAGATESAATPPGRAAALSVTRTTERSRPLAGQADPPLSEAAGALPTRSRSGSLARLLSALVTATAARETAGISSQRWSRA